jgi:hypothetical protein
MRKIFHIQVLLLLILTACKKNEGAYFEDIDAPAASTQMSRSFYYPEENLTIAQTYVQHINHICKLDEEGNLVLNFNIPFKSGRDEVTFIIQRDKIKADFIGVYEIKPSKVSDVAAFYLYRLTTSSPSRFLPENSTGVLTITKYDNKFKTLSGSYSLTINSINDPASSTDTDFKETTTSVSGSFENIQLQNE